MKIKLRGSLLTGYQVSRRAKNKEKKKRKSTGKKYGEETL